MEEPYATCANCGHRLNKFGDHRIIQWVPQIGFSVERKMCGVINEEHHVCGCLIPVTMEVEA
jgi:hypothetical protein